MLQNTNSNIVLQAKSGEAAVICIPDGEVELRHNNATKFATSASGVTVTGDATVTSGDIVFGTAGKGICLGVTSNTDANTLDDYEEGTWTPGFNLGSPTYTTTYSRTGRYTKIGNVCHVHMEIYMGSISFGDATQTMQISGLPFTSNSAGATFGVACATNIHMSNMYTHGSTYNNLGAGDDGILHVSPRLAASAVIFDMGVSPFSNSVAGYLRCASFHNGSGLVVGMTYRTA
jgi:hypothetical protein